MYLTGKVFEQAEACRMGSHTRSAIDGLSSGGIGPARISRNRVKDWTDLAAWAYRALPGAGWKTTVCFGLGTAQICLALSVPLVGSWIIDDLVLGRGASFWADVRWLALVTILQSAFALFGAVFVLRMDEDSGRRMRQAVLDSVLNADFRVLERYTTGDLQSRIVNDCTALKNVLTAIILPPIWDLLTLVGLAVLLLRLNPILALFTFAMAPVAVLFGFWMRPRVRAATARFRESLGGISTCLHTWLGDGVGLKLNSLEAQASTRFSIANDQMRASAVSIGRYGAIEKVISALVSGLPSLFIFGYGGTKVLDGDMTVGTLFAFTSLAALVNSPLQRCVHVFAVTVPAAGATVTRVRELVGANGRTIPDVTIKTSANEAASVQALRMTNVRFRYDASLAIEIPELHVRRGEIVGLVGSNGSGKSTIGHLLGGLRAPDSGSIELHRSRGGPESGDTGTLRRSVAVLQQRVVLFEGTILENITLFASFPNLSRLRDVSEASCVQEWLSVLPAGWDTRIDPGVAKSFSGGERQKIGLARMLYLARPVLFLDEPTANLDENAMRRFWTVLRTLPSQAAVIIATHRAEEIAMCDRLYQMALSSHDAGVWTCTAASSESVLSSRVVSHDASGRSVGRGVGRGEGGHV